MHNKPSAMPLPSPRRVSTWALNNANTPMHTTGNVVSIPAIWNPRPTAPRMSFSKGLMDVKLGRRLSATITTTHSQAPVRQPGLTCRSAQLNMLRMPALIERWHSMMRHVFNADALFGQ